jgi:hypothetical protein
VVAGEEIDDVDRELWADIRRDAVVIAGAHRARCCVPRESGQTVAITAQAVAHYRQAEQYLRAHRESTRGASSPGHKRRARDSNP